MNGALTHAAPSSTSSAIDSHSMAETLLAGSRFRATDCPLRVRRTGPGVACDDSSTTPLADASPQAKALRESRPYGLEIGVPAPVRDRRRPRFVLPAPW